jgi:uncharacterized protein (TIGR02996 family)
MGIEDAFLHDILAHPDDDAPRLIYADWLDEHNDPHGEFIRIQCALAQLSDEDPRRWPLELREQELLREHEGRWLPKGIGKTSCVFRRGFVEEITLFVQDFFTVVERLFEQIPLKHIRLRGTSHSEETGRWREQGLGWRQVAQSPCLARLRGLSLGFSLDVEDLQRLSESPYLTNLMELRLLGPLIIGEGEIARIDWERAINAPALRSLTFANQDFHIEELPILAISSSLTSLRELNLSGNRLTQEAVRMLAENRLLSQLETLNLDYNYLGDGGALAMREWPALPRLTRLSLASNQVFAAGVKALAEAPALRELISLNLSRNISCDEGAAALAFSGWTRLQALNLWFNGVGDRGVQALAHSEMLSQLTRLNLTTNCITDVGARALIESPHLSRLARLDLQRNDISAAGQQRLRDRFGPFVYC